MDDCQIAKIILRRLLRKNKIGAAHTDTDNLIRGVRGDLRGRARELLKELIKSGHLLAKKTPYGSGLHVSINPKKLDEISRIIADEK